MIDVKRPQHKGTVEEASGYMHSSCVTSI